MQYQKFFHSGRADNEPSHNQMLFAYESDLPEIHKRNLSQKFLYVLREDATDELALCARTPDDIFL
jgi:hypothetical protein